MTQPRAPRIVGLLVIVGLAIAGNRWAPGVLPAVLGLVVLYVALSNTPRLLELVDTVPTGLQSAFHGAPAHAGGGRKP